MLEQGVAPESVLEELGGFTGKDVDWQSGRVLTGLYDPGHEAHELAVKAYTRFLAHNALYVNMYPSLSRLEQEVVASVLMLLRGDEQTVGNITSGGTESILMAVKTARDWARVNRPEVRDPQIVVPVTAHPAFIKAAYYCGLRVVQTPVDTQGFRADMPAFVDALGPETVLAVGSAPNFSHGTIDPIEAMSEAARERGILFHVDGCVGGIYLSLLRRMGEPVRDFDFSLPGVTSISADLHKYGYVPKNASVVMYRNRDLRQHAWFVSTETTGYAVINPTVQSTRTGGPVAAAWAMFRYMGEAGYAGLVRRSQQATAEMLAAIKDMDDIEVLADPEMCMFTLASDSLNVFEIDDEMRARGWHMIPQFACAGGPANLHVSVSDANVARTHEFLAELEAVVTQLRENGSGVDQAGIEQMVAEVQGQPPEAVMEAMVPVLGLEGAELPERMATLNTGMNLLPAATRNAILALYFNIMY